VLLLGGHFVLLRAERAAAGGGLGLTLQEAGACQPFRVELPGHGPVRQRRVHAELCAAWSSCSLLRRCLCRRC